MSAVSGWMTRAALGGLLMIPAAPMAAQVLVPLDVPSQIIAISSNGEAVVGFDGFSSFRWTSRLGLQGINLPSSTVFARAVSGDGSVVVGQALGQGAFAWTESAGVVLLGDALFQHAFGTSDDGGVIVGGSSTRAIRWTISGQRFLDDLGLGSFAESVNGDGTVIAGSVATPSGGRAALWTSAGLHVLDVLSGFDNAEGRKVSRDGSTVIAWCFQTGGPPSRSFRWTAQRGIEDLGALPGHQMCLARGISADGRTIVGGSAQAPGWPFHGFLWTADLGMLDFEQFLRDGGVDLRGWSPGLVPLDVSADGRFLVGTGTYEGNDKGWMVVLPRCGSANFNHDGDTGTDADIEAFFACVAGTCCATCGSADFNGDGDAGTDADIESLFRVLAGGTC